jgi:hypothetical protein
MSLRSFARSPREKNSVDSRTPRSECAAAAGDDGLRGGRDLRHLLEQAVGRRAVLLVVYPVDHLDVVVLRGLLHIGCVRAREAKQEPAADHHVLHRHFPFSGLLKSATRAMIQPRTLSAADPADLSTPKRPATPEPPSSGRTRASRSAPQAP